MKCLIILYLVETILSSRVYRVSYERLKFKELYETEDLHIGFNDDK